MLLLDLLSVLMRCKLLLRVGKKNKMKVIYLQEQVLWNSLRYDANEKISLSVLIFSSLQRGKIMGSEGGGLPMESKGKKK